MIKISKLAQTPPPPKKNRTYCFSITFLTDHAICFLPINPQFPSILHALKKKLPPPITFRRDTTFYIPDLIFSVLEKFQSCCKNATTKISVKIFPFFFSLFEISKLNAGIGCGAELLDPGSRQHQGSPRNNNEWHMLLFMTFYFDLSYSFQNYK